jgi:KDO2-lipid IV(A) lauroyltransferase
MSTSADARRAGRDGPTARPAPPLHKRVKRGVRSVLVVLLVRILGLLPLRAALALGTALGVLAFHLAGKTRALALRSLATAFPDLSEGERLALARRAFVHLGRAALEVAAIRSYDHRLDRYVELARPDHLASVMARGKGMVFVTGHVGNWELLARRIARAGVPNAVIAKAGLDARLNRLAERFRASGGVTTLWREDPSTGRAILRTFKAGHALGILVDQDTDVQGVFVPFFGKEAYTPRAAADLALRFGAPVVVGWVHRKSARPADGHLLHTVEIPYDPVPADREAEVVRVTAACSAALESAIRAHPEEWVWMHARWKTRPPEEPPVAADLARPVPKNARLSSP